MLLLRWVQRSVYSGGGVRVVTVAILRTLPKGCGVETSGAPVANPFLDMIYFTRTIVSFALLTMVLSAETYQLQPSPGSRFGLEVYKTGLLSGKKHDFTFEKFSGTWDFNRAQPTESKVTFTLPAESLVCHDDWSPAKGSLEKIISTALNDVLETKKYPEIKFVSTKVEAQGTDSYRVTGDLSLRGVTKPAVVDVKLKNMGETILVEGKSTIKLTDYKIKPPSAGFGTVGTRNEIELMFNLKAGR